MKRTDKEAIEDLMAVNTATELCVRVILARSGDLQVCREAQEILKNVERSRQTLSTWWLKARRRRKS